MKKIINDNFINTIIDMYLNKNMPTSLIAKELSVSVDTVRRALKTSEIASDILKSNKRVVYGKKVTWYDSEEELLKQMYNSKSTEEIFELLDRRHTISAIKNKARTLGLCVNKEWSNEEDEILINNYSIVSKETIQQMLPNRSMDSIINHAMRLGIKSNSYLNEKYSEEQKEFIIDNFKILTDKQIAECLNKPVSGIQEQRRKLGLYYLDKTYSKYENLNKIFRGQLGTWKELSMKQCGYQCVLTGSKDFEVHHLYSFNAILEECFELFEMNNMLHGTSHTDYSSDEINNMIDIFKTVHEKYPLGVCIRKDIHKDFHRLYGLGNNTPEQWEEYVKLYKTK